MLEAPKVHMFLSPKLIVQDSLSYVLRPTVYNYCPYCHKVKALRSDLKRTLRQKHAEAKNESKGKRNSKMQGGV